MSRQASLSQPLRRERSISSDSTETSKRHDDGATKDRIFTSEIQIDVDRLGYDSTKYAAIIVPLNLIPAFHAILNNLAEPIRNNTMEDVEEMAPKEFSGNLAIFTTQYDTTRKSLSSSLNNFSETELKRDLSEDDFVKFKEFRKQLTKWYVVCQNLHNKAKKIDPDQEYLTWDYKFSPVIHDDNLIENCHRKLKNTKMAIENELSSKVIDMATTLNNDIYSKYMEIKTDSAQLKIFMKALRVVFRSNRHLFLRNLNKRDGRTYRKPSFRAGRPSVSQYDKSTKPRHSRTYYGNRNGSRFVRDEDANYTDRRRFRRHYENREGFDRDGDRGDSRRYDRDFPPPTTRDRDYRTFKRRPADYEDDDGEDDVFLDDRVDHFRPRRRYSYRR